MQQALVLRWGGVMGDEEIQAASLLGRPHPGLHCLWTRGWADGKSLDDVGWGTVCDALVPQPFHPSVAIVLLALRHTQDLGGSLGVSLLRASG